MAHMKKLILPLLTALVLVFIFSNSFAGQEESAQDSAFIMQLIEPILELFVGKGNVTQHLVRKLAHFCEFGLLGLLLGLRSRKPNCRVLLLALLCALTDETIQIFTGRGPQVQDVWLDFAGAVTGILAGCVLMLIGGIIAKRRKNRQPRLPKNA